jgi:hypothetical protein
MADDEIISAMGLALAVVAALIERPEPVPRGEVARCLRLLAQTASHTQPRQAEILESWAILLQTAPAANQD